MKKRLFALMLVLVMLISCVACGDKETASVDDEDAKKTEASTEGTTDAPNEPEAPALTTADKIQNLVSGIELTGVNAVQLEICGVEMGAKQEYDMQTGEIIKTPGTKYDFKVTVATDAEAQKVSAVIKYAKAGSVYKDFADLYYVNETLYVDFASFYTNLMTLNGADTTQMPALPTGYLKLTKAEIEAMAEMMMGGGETEDEENTLQPATEETATPGFTMEDLANMEISPVIYTELIKQVALYVGSFSAELPEGLLTVTDSDITINLTPANIDGAAKAISKSDLETYAKAYANAIKDDELGAKISQAILENVEGINAKLAGMNTDGNSNTPENAGEYIKLVLSKYDAGFGVSVEMFADNEKMKLAVATMKVTTAIEAPSTTYTMSDLQNSMQPQIVE